MQLMLSGVTYTHPSAVDPILNNVSITFPTGWTGLLGDNGCGKSTLVNIAAGIIKPDAGAVTQGLVCALCPQDAAAPPENLSDFALDYGTEARRLRTAFNLEDDMPWRFDELSFGERKKLQIACALWRRPDVLILDEPTNHLDGDARQALEQTLAGFRGIGIVVSHDRELLDALVDRCVSFEPGGRLVERPGGYTAAHQQAELERTTTMRERAQAKADLARLQAEKLRRDHEAARAQAQRSKRHIDPKDTSAKAVIDLAIFTGKDGQAGRLSSPDGGARRRRARTRGTSLCAQALRRRALDGHHAQPAKGACASARRAHPVRFGHARGARTFLWARATTWPSWSQRRRQVHPCSRMRAHSSRTTSRCWTSPKK